MTVARSNRIFLILFDIVRQMCKIDYMIIVVTKRLLKRNKTPRPYCIPLAGSSNPSTR